MMRTSMAASILACALLGIAGSAAAHHPPRFERCKVLTVTGQIESVNWANPHVELTVKAESGTSYRVVWLSLQQLGRAGIQRDTLQVGDEVVITAGTRDGASAPILLSEIHRPSDGWTWSQPPEGC
jgi:hypothetical protein